MSIKCSVCRDASSVKLEDKHLFLYRCGACGHVFKNIPEEKKEKYDESYFSKMHKNWFNNPDYLLFEFIRKEVVRLAGTRSLRVLDVGCGKGDFLKYLKKRNPKLELHGIDLIDNCYPGINFMKGDILKDEIGMKFDIISNLAVIEHVDFPALFIEKAKGLLSPEGIIFTVTDNDDSMVYSLARVLKKTGFGAAYDRLYSTHHLQCFSNRSLKTLMETTGLDLIMQKNRNHPVKAVDYPEAGFITAMFYIAAMHIVFSLSSIFNDGILQLAICKKR